MATRRTRSSTAEITPKQEEPSSEEEEDEEEGEEEEDGEEVDEGEEDEEEEGEEEDEEEEDEEEEEEEDDEEEDTSSKRESIRRLLEPFGKEQLVELLKEAARADSSVLHRISTAADSDTTHRKIFVHGLGWDATSDTLRSAFDQYDDVDECNVVTDRSTGKSKGYGFVLLRTRAGTLRALQEPQKRIGNRLAACQLASTGPIHAQGNATTDPKGRKIFVNNVGPNVDMDKLRKFFAQFGEIEEGPLGYDRATGKLRGFAIFVYKTIEGCRRALEEPTKFFEGSQLHCQRAVEADKIRGGQAAVGALGAALPQNDLNLTASLMGLNPAAAAALLGQNVGSLAGGLAGQGAGGVGGLNPALGGGAAATGLSALANQNAAGLGLGAGSGIGSVNSSIPGVAGNYSSQLGLQGLGVQQSSQIPHSASLRSQSGLGPFGNNLPPFLGR